MLKLLFKREEYAFVYVQGRAVGAIRIGEVKSGGETPKVALLFSGSKSDFEVLRPSVVAFRYGEQELARLVREFWSERKCPR